MQEIKVLSTYRLSLKSKILDSAMLDFAQRGIKSVKMDDIAKGLNISKRTLYELYENKEILLYECIKKAKAQDEREMLTMMSQHDNVIDIILNIYKIKIEQFKQVTPQFYSDLEKFPKVMSYLEEQHERDRVLQKQFIVRGVEEGYFRKDVDIDIVIIMFDALSQYVRRTRLYNQYPVKDIFNNMLFISFRGICTQKGIEVIDRFLTNE
ncbi:TetR/AcrR family transcriptional regulator [Prevotella sp. E15-22]|uniref:TetR/AcrR family transcriptional regulator n=1 Tax=Prevotella sp. E15-22 TaxID=2937774 RepID=UPI002053BF24|nr:TetR/AcrR family transcriptional regulator [Prevotella sp. E15-22]UPS45828.1 TetR/AcrR family transcriptional regulator [Prevotella sp. E15-22]